MTLFTGEVSRHHDTDHTTDEVLDTGDGIQTLFTGRSLHFPIKFGTVQIEFTIGATTYQVTESGGVFTHAQITAATIDEDGNYSFQFASALDDTTELKILQYSTKGFLTKLLELVSVAPTKEVVGTGTGAQLIFNFTITGAGAIEPGNVRLRWIQNGVEFDLWDNASGQWEHPNIASSSINYSTRVCTITFDTGNAPASSTNIDVWSIPAGEEWVQVLEARTVTTNTGSTEPDADGQQEVILKNCGVSGREEIIIGLREYSYIASDIFGLELALGRRWTYQDDIDSYFWDNSGNRVFPYAISYNITYNAQKSSVKFVYSNDVMKYWVNVTKSRIIIVSRNTGTIFTSCYVGEGIRYSSQSKYSKPQVVAGNTISFYPFTSTAIYGLARPAVNCWLFFDENNEYRWLTTSINTYGYFTTMNAWTNTALLKRTLLNKVFVQRMQLFYFGETTGTYWQKQKILFSLDGVFICPDNDIDSEHTLNTDEYIAFQDVYRTTYQDYFCITQD